MVQPKTSYARNGDVNIAYQVMGDGPLDLLFIPPFVSHLDLYWAAPETTAFFSRLASFSRLILFDKRGTGLSDPVSGVATLEERMEDVRAVLDACGSQRTALFGLSEGGPMSLLFAATYPERTTTLITFGSFAKLLPARNYFWDWREGVSYAEDVREHVERTWDQTRAFRDALEHRWGEGEALALYVPSIATTLSTVMVRENWNLSRAMLWKICGSGRSKSKRRRNLSADAVSDDAGSDDVGSDMYWLRNRWSS